MSYSLYLCIEKNCLKVYRFLFSSALKVLLLIMITGGFFASCSNDDGSDFQQGIFADSPVQGITYSTPSINGETDRNGTYFYKPGEVVKFSIAGVQLGSATGASLITPVDLIMGAVDETDATVTNIARFLLSLDDDCNPSNGISINKTILDEIRGRDIDFSSSPEDFENDTLSLFYRLSAVNLFTCGEVNLCPVDEARRHLRTTIRGIPQFRLTIKAGNHSTVIADPEHDFYDFCELVTLTAVPESGWRFKEWIGDASPYENPVTLCMNTDKVVVCVPETVAQEFFDVPVVLRITEDGYGIVDVNPPGGVYHADPHGYINKNIVVTLTAKPDPGWIFSHWESDLTGADNPETIVIDAYKNVTAVFKQLPSNKHTLWIDKEGLGGVRLEPPGGVYYKGTQVLINAIPDNGWEFTQWGGDLTGSDFSKTISMDSNYTVSAEFTEISGTQYILTALTDRGTVVDFSPPVERETEGSTVRVKYKAGTTVTVTAVTRPGYTFVEWGGDLSGSQNPETIVMDCNKTISLISREAS